ncbi:MAG: hypothetical protein MRY74_16180 [Neomegalonema sp.]|nr:hypothetical protein [Neomegalonema sp.]
MARLKKRRLALSLCVALAPAVAPEIAAAGDDPVLHYDCRVHGVRPYPHRHVDPDAAVIPCERTPRTGLYPVAARCVAHAIGEGGRYGIVPGTEATTTTPLEPEASADSRADALNLACKQALKACSFAVAEIGAYDARCKIMDRSFEH